MGGGLVSGEISNAWRSERFVVPILKGKAKKKKDPRQMAVMGKTLSDRTGEDVKERKTTSIGCV